MHSLLNEIHATGASFPFGRDKDASTKTSTDGTDLKESTIGDIRQALYTILHQSGIEPNEQPETVDNSQIVQALDAMYSTVGEIVQIQGQPDPNARLLQLNGQTIDLDMDRYADLKKYIEYNETIYTGTGGKDKFTIFTADATETDNWKFKRDKTNNNLLTLPKANQGDALIANTDNNKVGNVSTGAALGHDHHATLSSLSKNFTINNLNINLTHKHTDNIHVVGYIDTLMTYEIANTHPSGAFYLTASGYGAKKGQIHNNHIFYATIALNGVTNIVNSHPQKIIMDTNRAGSKLGTIETATLNASQTINLTNQSLNLANARTSTSTSNPRNTAAGCFVNLYIRY